MQPSDALWQDYQRRCASAGPDHLDTLQVRSNLVATLIREGRYDEALEHSAPLVDARERIQGPERADTLKARRNHALALWLAGHPRKAILEASILLPQAEHCLGASNQITELVRGDLDRWTKETGIDLSPERPTLPPPKFDASTPFPSMSKEQASYLNYIRREYSLILLIDNNEEDARGPADRRDMYRRTGQDHEVVDLEIRAGAAAGSGDFELALELLDEAIPRLRRIYVREGRTILKARLLRARCLVGLDRTDDAVAALGVLLATAERILGRHSPVTTEVRTLLAQQELIAGDSAAAAEHFEQLVELGAITPPGEDSPRVDLEARVAAAVAVGQGGDLVRGHQDLSDALVDAYSLVEPDDPWLLRLRYSHAAMLGYSGQVTAAVELLRAVLKDMEEARGPFDADSRDCREVLARLLYRSGARREANALIEDLFVLARRAEGPSAPQALRAYDLASFWKSQGEQPFGFGS